MSFGCNDDGALGTASENDAIPSKVNLPMPVNLISAGDSHSTATNTANSAVYYWGVYRNIEKGNICDVCGPTRIGEHDFRKSKITKVLSGAHHTLVLADGHVYAWGDSDSGILGRLPTARRKVE